MKNSIIHLFIHSSHRNRQPKWTTNLFYLILSFISKILFNFYFFFLWRKLFVSFIICFIWLSPFLPSHSHSVPPSLNLSIALSLTLQLSLSLFLVCKLNKILIRNKISPLVCYIFTYWKIFSHVQENRK